MLKNPVCPDLELWTGAVERLLDIDLKQLSLIHRGFSVLDAAPYRNIPCLEMALEMKKRFPGLPLFCDPSHICGKRGLLYGICAEALRLDMVYLSNRIAVRRWHCRMQPNSLLPKP